MAVPFTFGSATAAIPLSQLDNNFATTITLGNTAIQLGNTVTTLNNMTLANVTISSVSTAITAAQGGTGLTAVGSSGNVLTSNGTTWLSQAPAGNVTIGNTTINLGGTATSVGNLTLTNATISSVSTPITPAQGGTGLATLTANNVLIGNGTSNVAFVAPGTNGNVLTSNGTAWVSSTPSAFAYPGVGIANSTGSAWGTSYSTSGSGTVVALNNTPTLTNPTVTNYTETTVTANTSTAYTIDNTNGTLQILTLTGNCTFTFPTATAGKSFTMLLKQDATGSRTVTWPASVKWPSGTAPTITATASRADKYVFTADGSSWVGSNAGQNYTL
jgi:hypothetical protein